LTEDIIAFFGNLIDILSSPYILGEVGKIETHKMYSAVLAENEAVNKFISLLL